MSERYQPPPLHELVGEDIPPEVQAELARVDALLRSVPALPELPARLRHAAPPVEPHRRRRFTIRRTAVAFAAAAAIAAGSFALGAWVAHDGFDAQAAVAMEPTSHARDASAVLSLGAEDASGNRTIRLEVSGLPELPRGGYYFLWLAKDGEYAAPCGTFAAGDGGTTAEWTVSYRINQYDAWVITARLPGAKGFDAPWLLQASIET